MNKIFLGLLCGVIMSVIVGATIMNSKIQSARDNAYRAGIIAATTFISCFSVHKSDIVETEKSQVWFNFVHR